MGLQLELHRTSTMVIECAEAVTCTTWGTWKASVIYGYLVCLIMYPIFVC